MEWWYFGPVVLAIIMFLLVGTVFERRIETAWQQFMERRRLQLAEMVAQDQLQTQGTDQATNQPAAVPPASNTSPTPCHATPASCNAEPTPPRKELPMISLCGEVPISDTCEITDTAVRTASKKSLRSRKSSAVLSRQSILVVKS